MTKTFICREGFWRHRDDNKTSHMPLPIPSQLRWIGQAEFIKALKLVQKSSRIKTRAFKGDSKCRVCEKKNGSTEFSLTTMGVTWQWPVGFLHYAEDHNIRPSFAFQEFICEVADSILIKKGKKPRYIIDFKDITIDDFVENVNRLEGNEILGIQIRGTVLAHIKLSDDVEDFMRMKRKDVKADIQAVMHRVFYSDFKFYFARKDGRSVVVHRLEGVLPQLDKIIPRRSI